MQIKNTISMTVTIRQHNRSDATAAVCSVLRDSIGLGLRHQVAPVEEARRRAE